MDHIEFRPMNNGIQATGSATLDAASAQGKTGCDNGCYGNGRNTGNGNNNDGYSNSYNTNGNNGINGNNSTNGSNGYNNKNGSCNTQTTETGSDGHIHYRSCEEAKIKLMPDREIDQTGRVLDVTMTLRNVCPYRHVSVGCLVTEMDDENNEYSRGFKAFTVQPHYNARPCDMELDTVRFILPDDVCTNKGARHFVVRTDAHYADTAVTMN